MSIGGAVTAGAIIVGTAELIKLANTLLQAHFQAAALAQMTEAEIEANYQAVKKDYIALPDPGSIPDPKSGG